MSDEVIQCQCNHHFPVPSSVIIWGFFSLSLIGIQSPAIITSPSLNENYFCSLAEP